MRLFVNIFPPNVGRSKNGFESTAPLPFKSAKPRRSRSFARSLIKLHEQGTDLFVNRVLTRMSVPKSLDYRIARELLAEIKREILANGRATVE